MQNQQFLNNYVPEMDNPVTEQVPRLDVELMDNATLYSKADLERIFDYEAVLFWEILAACDFNRNRMVLSKPRFCPFDGDEFIDEVVGAITHETMHHVLDEVIDRDTSLMLDTLLNFEYDVPHFHRLLHDPVDSDGDTQ